MLDFTEQAHSTTSPPVSSPDTQTVSDNLRAIDEAFDSGDKEKIAEVVLKHVPLYDPETTAATKKALAPFMATQTVFTQTEDDFEEV